MNLRSYKGIAVLCLAITIGVAAVSAIGVFGRGDLATETVTSPRGETFEMVTQGVYAFNPERLVAEGVGWDVFTLVFAVPAMLLALPGLARGSLRAKLLALGLLAYFFYQYLMYSMTWALGPMFVPWIALYAVSLAGIVWLGSTLDLAGMPGRFDSRFPARGVAIFSIVMGSLLVLMWAARIRTALSGDLEAAMLLGQTTLVVQALDLGLVVPAAMFTGITVWKRRPIGFVLAPVFMIKGLAMSGAITAMLVGAWMVEGTPDMGGFAIFVPATLVSLWLSARVYLSATR